jgi:hypothetical protein
MNNLDSCALEKESADSQGTVHCAECNRELDYLTSLVSENPRDAIYICFESIKQKIFVYGKYTGGKYGAIQFLKYYTKQECTDKECEKNIKDMLASLKKDEYSRLINCKKGNMDSVILTKDIIEARKKDLLGGSLDGIFKNANSEKKYYCHAHAEGGGFKCTCGADLVKLGSEQHRDLTGMEDQKFMETFLAQVLSL